MKGNVYQNHFS